MQAGHPLTVALVGALYAVSFDTVSQSVLFAVTALRFGGVGSALFIGLLFALGMMMTDGLNGLWISRLIARSDHISVSASRAMGVSIAAASLLTAAYGAAKLVVPNVASWSNGHEWTIGTAVMAMILVGYLAARRLSPSFAAASVPHEV
jgi:high-affinity nickel-transport protein